MAAPDRTGDVSAAGTCRLSVIIPVLNEAEGIGAFLSSLQYLRDQEAELIVVDGGSKDGTAALCGELADKVVVAPPGRAAQMNLGARLARGGALCFLHADTRLPAGLSVAEVVDRLESGSGWGFCPVRLSGSAPVFRVIERFMCWRSRLTGIGTGDQVLWVLRPLFVDVGGFPHQPLMEDVAICKRLKAIWGRPVNPGFAVTTSSRRWQSRGVLRTVLLMWQLRLLYFIGVEPRRLHRRYYRQ